jgi:hypothetical protein
VRTTQLAPSPPNKNLIFAQNVKAEVFAFVVLAALKKTGLKHIHIEEKGFKRNNLELDLITFSNAI